MMSWERQRFFSEASPNIRCEGNRIQNISHATLRAQPQSSTPGFVLSHHINGHVHFTSLSSRLFHSGLKEDQSNLSTAFTKHLNLFVVKRASVLFCFYNFVLNSYSQCLRTAASTVSYSNATIGKTIVSGIWAKHGPIANICGRRECIEVLLQGPGCKIQKYLEVRKHTAKKSAIEEKKLSAYMAICPWLKIFLIQAVMSG